MRLRLTPRDDSYFEMFADSANNLVIAARLLVELISDGADRDAIGEKMRACEHAGDERTHAIMRRLNESFVTPFDREDIYRLASCLDDVMDSMEAAVDLIGSTDWSGCPRASSTRSRSWSARPNSPPRPCPGCAP